MLAEYTPGIVRDLQVPNPRGSHSVCCLLPGLHVHPRQDHDCTIHQGDCKLSEQQDGGTRRYVSTEDFQVGVCILILLSDPHLGMPPASLYLLPPWKRRWTTTSISGWASPPRWSPPDHRDPTGEGGERKPILCPCGSCGQAGQMLPLSVTDCGSHCETPNTPHTLHSQSTTMGFWMTLYSCPQGQLAGSYYMLTKYVDNGKYLMNNNENKKLK